MSFKRSCERAGVEDLRFHDLKHDFATALVQSGVDLYRVQMLCGHKDSRMTLRYAHLLPENLRDAIKVLDSREGGYVLVTLGENKKGLALANP